MDDFNRTASVVATNIQKLVQNVSSMQRMLVHVDSQVSSHLLLIRNRSLVFLGIGSLKNESSVWLNTFLTSRVRG